MLRGHDDIICIDVKTKISEYFDWVHRVYEMGSIFKFPSIPSFYPPKGSVKAALSESASL